MKPLQHSIWAAERHRDAGVVLDPDRGVSLPNRLRVNAHGLPETFDFGFFDLNAALPSGSALEIVDREGATAQHELPGIGAGQPVVKTGDRNSEPQGGFLSR